MGKRARKKAWVPLPLDTPLAQLGGKQRKKLPPGQQQRGSSPRAGGGSSLGAGNSHQTGGASSLGAGRGSSVEAGTAPPHAENEMQRRIRRRGAAVRAMGEYIGLWELAVWSHLRRRAVWIAMGDGWVELAETVGPVLQGVLATSAGRPAHLAGCHWNAALNEWAPVQLHDASLVRHWVIAHVTHEAEAEFRRHERLSSHLQGMGCTMIPTQTQGDCGIDALSFYDQELNTSGPLAWKRLRAELEKHMVELAVLPEWQEVYRQLEAFDVQPGAVASEAPEARATAASSSAVAPRSPTSSSASDASTDFESDAESEASSSTGPPSVISVVDSDARADSAAGGTDAESEVDDALSQLATEIREEVHQARKEREHDAATTTRPEAETATPVGELGSASSLGAVGPASSLVAARSAGPAPSLGAASPATVPITQPGGGVAGSGAPAQAANAPRDLRHSNFNQFEAHMRTLSETALEKATQSVRAYKQCEAEWVRTAVLQEMPHTPANRTVQRISSMVSERIKLGMSYKAWLRTEAGRAATATRHQRRAFLVLGTARAERDVTKAETQRLQRAYEESLEYSAVNEELNEDEAKLLESVRSSRKRRVAATDPSLRDELVGWKSTQFVGNPLVRGRLPTEGQSNSGPAPRMRRRALGRQGHPFKCPALRERMWDWFVNMRTAYVTISPMTVIRQATREASKVVKEMRRTNTFTPMPVLDRKWVRGWRRQYNISLRNPNRKFKVPRAVLVARLRVMWGTNVRVRWLAVFTLGHDLAAMGLDQKPVYFNEGGHKGQKCLAVVGEEDAIVRDNLAQSRQRCSAMTTVTSVLKEATAQKLPVELCFKGNSRKILRKLPDLKTHGISLTFQYSSKGSYRAEHVARFLRRHLPKFSAERKACGDYRLLYLDAYKAHFDRAIVDIAWERGFIVVYHGAGTTGLVQVNDTHNHNELENLYIRLEDESIAAAQEDNPGVVSRSREDVATDFLAAWRNMHHERGATGHKANGLTNDLEGKEDWLLRSAVLAYWRDPAIDVPRMRREAKEEIKRRVESGELRWDRESIDKVRLQWGERGAGAYAKEGQELEAAQADDDDVELDEAYCETDEEAKAEKAATQQRTTKKAVVETSLGAQASSELEPHDVGGTMVPAVEGDREEDAAVARRYVEQMELFKDVHQRCKGSPHLTSFCWTLERKMHQMTKLHFQAAGSQKQNTVLRRFFDVLGEKEQQKRDRRLRKRLKLKKKIAKAKLEKQKLANEAQARVATAAKARAAAKKEAKEAAQRRALVDRYFTAKELKGATQKEDAATRQARHDFLQRLLVLHGPLEPTLEVFWTSFRAQLVKYTFGMGRSDAAAFLLEQKAKVKERVEKDPGYLNKWMKKLQKIIVAKEVGTWN